MVSSSPCPPPPPETPTPLLNDDTLYPTGARWYPLQMLNLACGFLCMRARPLEIYVAGISLQPLYLTLVSKLFSDITFAQCEKNLKLTGHRKFLGNEQPCYIVTTFPNKLNNNICFKKVQPVTQVISGLLVFKLNSQSPNPEP